MAAPLVVVGNAPKRQSRAMGRGEERAGVIVREVTPMEAVATTKWR
jgi:hypothetical protein